MDTDMDLQRLGALIEAYGAQPRRWPAAERGPALALLEASPEARQWLAQARSTDALLDGVVARPAPAALRERLLARAPAPRRGWRTSLSALWRDLGGWNLAGPALAAGLALGLGMGVGLSPLPPANGLDDDALYQLAGLEPGADAYELWIDEP